MITMDEQVGKGVGEKGGGIWRGEKVGVTVRLNS